MEAAADALPDERKTGGGGRGGGVFVLLLPPVATLAWWLPVRPLVRKLLATGLGANNWSSSLEREPPSFGLELQKIDYHKPGRG